MLTATDSPILIDHPRSIIVSMVELLDGFEARLPQIPDSCTWKGRAKTHYAVELGVLRDSMAFLRYQLEATLEQLAGVGDCG